MSTLSEKLLGETRPQVESDCVKVIEEEVASKKGISGVAVKAAFATIKTFKRDILPDAVSHLLPDFVTTMEPFYAEHLAAGGTDITAFTSTHAERIADALLGITDGRAAGSKHKVLVKAYKSLRPQGKKQVIAAMPRLGAMLAAHGC